MNIQYVGFIVGVNSRTYSFHVIDAIEKMREFTVEIQSEAFRLSRLKFQDGPGICFARLQRALGRETPESRAEPRLRIREQDIWEYLDRRHPRKAREGRGAAKPFGSRRSY